MVNPAAVKGLSMFATISPIPLYFPILSCLFSFHLYKPLFPLSNIAFFRSKFEILSLFDKTSVVSALKIPSKFHYVNSTKCFE